MAEKRKRNWSRRDFVKMAGLLLAGGCVRPNLNDLERVGARRPNIVFILADDLGYGELGCYGQDKIKTPHLDHMAREGTRFTQAYAGSPVCAPSRAVLMTGLHTGHCRIRGNHALVHQGPSVPRELIGRRPFLWADDITVGEILQRAGYKTSLFGKWHLDGQQQFEASPLEQGFDHYTRFKKSLYRDDPLTDDALDYLDANAGDQPFFMFLSYSTIHMPYKVPDQGIYVGKDWTDEQKTYAAMISRMDANIGRVAARLEELGMDEDTVIFFSSDNGPAVRGVAPTGSNELRYFDAFGDGITHSEFFDSAGGLRGGKRCLEEGGIRVPLIARWPGKITAGQTCDDMCSFADLLPTAADLAGIDSPAGIDGVSMVSSLLGQSRDAKDRMLYWEFYERGFQQAARWRDWKALRLKMNESLELYDLTKDPGEIRNIASERPDVVGKFESIFRKCRSESPYWPSDRFILYIDD